MPVYPRCTLVVWMRHDVQHVREFGNQVLEDLIRAVARSVAYSDDFKGDALLRQDVIALGHNRSNCVQFAAYE